MGFEEKFVASINDHKGQLAALQSLVIALLRAMPIDIQARAIRIWDSETEIAKAAFLNSAAPDDFVAAYDTYVKILNDIRNVPPTDGP